MGRPLSHHLQQIYIAYCRLQTATKTMIYVYMYDFFQYVNDFLRRIHVPKLRVSTQKDYITRGHGPHSHALTHNQMPCDEKVNVKYNIIRVDLHSYVFKMSYF